MTRRRVLRRKHIASQKLDSEARKYIPLFGTWLVEMALKLDWYQPPSSRRWPDIFNDSDFCAMTPIDDSEDEDDSDDKPKRITAARCRKLLMNQQVQLHEMKLQPNLPLFKNVDLLSELLDLTEADQAVLTFAAGLNLFPEFSGAISSNNEKTGSQSFCRLLAWLTGIKEREFLRSVSNDSPLITSGLVKVNRKFCDLESKVNIPAV
ncbi:MAG: hypothetical protein WCP20_18895 [Desulfuromonadales bacterium]